jgi:hypothetical protein
MTFKDSMVIMDNDYDDGDVLENVDLQTSFRQRQKMNKNKGMNSFEAPSTDPNKKILPQYNDD